MPIQFACPYCGKQTTVADQFAGQSGPCAACGKLVTVPMPGVPVGTSTSSTKMIWIILLLVMVPVVLMCGGVGVAILLPAVQKARQAATRTQCMNNMKQLALAMHNYEAVHGTLPPVYTTDENGKPLHSWRTLLLPYLEHQNLASQIDLNEPWDSPKNKAIASQMPKVFGCAGDKAKLGNSTTDYVVIVGPETMFEPRPNGKGVKFQEISDGLSQTIMIIEVDGLDVPWMKPQDISIAELKQRGLRRPNGAASHYPGINIALGDGSARVVPFEMSRDELKAMSTRAGGERPGNVQW